MNFPNSTNDQTNPPSSFMDPNTCSYSDCDVMGVLSDDVIVTRNDGVMNKSAFDPEVACNNLKYNEVRFFKIYFKNTIILALFLCSTLKKSTNNYYKSYMKIFFQLSI